MATSNIETEQQYDDILRRIEGLMDATEGTIEADELIRLVSLVEIYEDRHFPMDRPGAVTAVRFRMEQQGLMRKALGYKPV